MYFRLLFMRFKNSFIQYWALWASIHGTYLLKCLLEHHSIFYKKHRSSSVLRGQR